MKVYYDERLCPEKFEQMAKEYSKLKQQLVIKKIDNNIGKKDLLTHEIKTNLNKVSSGIEYLSSFNLSSTNKINLKKLKEYKNKIKEQIALENIKIQNSNFCQSLQQTIYFCIDIIRKILELQNYCNEDEYMTYLNIQDNILEMINILVLMFGVCKYRK